MYCTYSSGVYDEGIVPGRKIFGDKLTDLHDEFIANNMITPRHCERFILMHTFFDIIFPSWGTLAIYKEINIYLSQ